MSTPLTTSQRNTYDALPYETKTYLYVDEPETVFVASNGGTNTTSNVVIGLTAGTVISGNYNDIKPGMTVELIASDGTRHGSQRVRELGTSTAIFTGRCARGNNVGELNPQSGDTIYVYNDARIWQKASYIDPAGTQFKDQTTYPGANEAQPPVANCKSVQAAISDGTAQTFTLADTGSFAVRAGATISSQSWDIGGGSVVIGTTTSTSLTVSFTRGRHVVRYTVTDSNGVSSTQSMLVLNLTKNDLLTANVAEIAQGFNTHTARIEATTDYFTSDYAPGVACVIFQNDDILDSNIRMYGWLGEQDIELSDAERGITSVNVRIDGVADRLRSLGAFPQTISNADDVTGSWYFLPDVNIDVLIHNIYYWHSTITEVCEFEWSGEGSSYPLPQLNSNGNNLLDQFDSLAQAIGYRLTVSETGKIRILPDPRVLPSTTQLGGIVVPTTKDTTKVTTLTESDYTDYRFTYDQTPNVKWLITNATIATDQAEFINAIRFRAPSSTPGQGVNTITQDNLLANLTTPAAEMRFRTANTYATIEANPFGALSLNMLKTRAIFEPSSLQLFGVELPSSTNALYNTSTSDVWLLQQTTDRYNAVRGIKRSQAEFIRVVDGVTAEQQIIPDSADSPTLNFDELEDFNLGNNTNLFNTNPAFNLNGLSANLVAILSNGRFAVTSNADDAGGDVNWAVYDHSETIGTDVRAWCLKAGATAVSGWVTTNTGVWYVQNAQSATPTFTDQTPAFTDGFYGIDADFLSAPGEVLIVSGGDFLSLNALYVSTDSGATWTQQTGYGQRASHTVIVDSVNPGTAYAGVNKGDFTARIWRTTDYFVTGAVILDDIGLNNDPPMAVGVDSPEILFYGANGVYRYNTQTGVDTQINPSTPYITPPADDGGGRFRFVISVDPNNANNVAYATIGEDIVVSRSALSSVPVWVTLTDGKVRRCAIVNGGQGVYGFGGDGRVSYSGDTTADGAMSILDGDLVTSAEVVGIAGY